MFIKEIKYSGDLVPHKTDKRETGENPVRSRHCEQGAGSRYVTGTELFWEGAARL